MIRALHFKIVSLFIVVGCFISAQFIGVAPTLAATIDKISVTCKWVSLRGKTEVRAPYVRVQVVLGSDLTNVLATQIVPTSRSIGASYRALLDISGAHLPDGTLVVVSAGEWDGAHYLRPATITSRNCNAGGGTPTPIPSATPTFVASPTFPPTLPPSATPTFIVSPTFPPTLVPSSTPTFVASPTFPPTPITPFPTVTRTPVVPSATPSPFLPTPFSTFTRTPLPPPTITRTPFVPSATPSPINPPSTPTPPPTYTPVYPPPTPTPPPY